MAAKFVLIVLTFYIVAVLCESPPAYETKYDDINLDELLKNDRLRRNYVKCLLNEGPCTPDGQELKSNTNTKSIRFISFLLSNTRFFR